MMPCWRRAPTSGGGFPERSRERGRKNIKTHISNRYGCFRATRHTQQCFERRWSSVSLSSYGRELDPRFDRGPRLKRLAFQRRQWKGRAPGVRPFFVLCGNGLPSEAACSHAQPLFVLVSDGIFHCCAAKDGGPGPSRTDTTLSDQRILSPVRLPVPPRGRPALS